MKKYLSLVFVPLFLSLFLSPVLASAKTSFMTYWFSWGQNNPPWVYNKLSDTPNGVDMVAVAFALETGANQLTLQNKDNNQLGQSIAALHQRGVKVLLSTGGQTGPYPWDDMTLSTQQVAQQYIGFINQFQFDGVDFDVESFGDGIARLPDIIKLIKASNPKLIISLTVASPGGSRGLDPAPIALAKKIYANGDLNYIDVMNYDQNWVQSGCTYESTDLTTNCYIQNIQAVEAVVEQWTNDPSKAKGMIMNGIMMGKADDQKIVKPEMEQLITKWLVANYYGGVMSWGLSRDQDGSNTQQTTGLTGYSLGAFTNAIIQAIQA